MDTDPTDTTANDSTANDSTANDSTAASGDTAPSIPPHDPSWTGADAAVGPPVRSEQRLHRARRGRMLGGVAMGLADYFDVDPTLVRVGFVALAFMGGLAVPLYLAGWLLIPDEETDLSVAEDLLDRERPREHSRAW
jgi:phage shock protein PspC (stress-responsive transcriptional regulator)